MAAADAAMAAELGVAPSVVETLRKTMTQGEHWTRDDTGRVSFTDTGRVRLLAEVNAPEKKEGGAAEEAGVVLPPSSAFSIWTEEVAVEKKMAPERAGEPVLLAIVRCHPNPHFVRVRTPEGLTADVRVRDNAKLRPRVTLRCRQVADGRWECCHQGQAVRLPALKKEEAAPAA